MPLPDVAAGDTITAAHINDIKDAAEAVPDAVDVPFTPAGTIAATNVQAAIEEVASEAGGGGGGGWDLLLDLPLTSLTNWTAGGPSGSGTWTAETDRIRQAATGVNAVYRLQYDALVLPAHCIVEVEARVDVAGSGSVSRAGLSLGTAAPTDTGGALAGLVATTNIASVDYETDYVTAIGNVALASSVALSTYATLRLVRAGDTITTLINSVRNSTVRGIGSAGIRPRFCLYVSNADASFRNLKVWAPTLP